MDKNWLAWWLIVIVSTVLTVLGLLLRLRGWKNE
jgi:hypothetical protein